MSIKKYFKRKRRIKNNYSSFFIHFSRRNTMKKIISFEKKIEFPSMIGEITSISLEEQLKFTDNSTIQGDLIVNGTYKITEASRIEEDFRYTLPTEILLTENLELSTVKLDIADFYYEIEEDNILTCHIDVSVEGMEIVEYEEEETVPLQEETKVIEELRECDGDPIESKEEEFNNQTLQEIVEEQDQKEKKEMEKEIEMKEEKEIKQEVKLEEIEEVEEEENVGSLFTSLKDSEETFSTYSVYMVREEISIESIMEKYSVTKEELENYNDLSSIAVGSKIIIPLKNDSV